MNPNDFPIHVQDNTINGKCSNCGECCTDFVPITIREYKTIKAYLKKHPEITNERYYTPEGIHVLCPFRDRETKRCKIYEVRPLVCQSFLCSFKRDKLIANRTFGIERAAYNNADPTTMVSFHTLFFGDIQWEVDVLAGYVGATSKKDFNEKIKALNPVIINQGLLHLEEEELE